MVQMAKNSPTKIVGVTLGFDEIVDKSFELNYIICHIYPNKPEA